MPGIRLGHIAYDRINWWAVMKQVINLKLKKEIEFSWPLDFVWASEQGLPTELQDPSFEDNFLLI